MCTVVFIPGSSKCQFASLRDENPQRPKAGQPTISSNGTVSYLAPLDGLAGGTWAGVNDFGHVIILLNGGHTNHQKQPYYSKSRGLIVRELLQSELPVVDWNLMDLTHTEPFTLVVWSDNHLFELVWNGQQQTKTMLDTSLPHIWSSSTLYPAGAKAYRSHLFYQWINSSPKVSRQSLLGFFRSYQHPENGFLMNRGGQIKTLSYSFIEISNNKRGLFSYHDFAMELLTSAEIPLRKTWAVCHLGQPTTNTEA
jgi:hypothetical protein